MGEYERAIADFAEAIGLSPGEARLYCDRGTAYDRKGATEEAMKDYEATLRIEPTNLVALHNRGRIHHGRGQLESAVRDYTKALEVEPKDFISYLNRAGAFIDLGDLGKAVADLNEAIRLDSRSESALENRGYAHTLLRDPDKAIRDYTEVLRINRTNSNAYFNRGRLLHLEKGQPETAIKDFAKAIELEPSQPHFFFARAMAWSARGEAAKSINDYRQTLQLSPDHAGAANDLAWLLATSPEPSLRNGTEAVALAKQACELTEWKAWTVIRTLAAAYAETGDFTQAVKYQKQTLSMPRFTDSERKEEEGRLALYQAHKPYRE